MSELRVAIAMGGGVSLGSFCGGALGETVKQLVESRAEGYDSVRFDVFSGASAGAMSLGLLVHTLASPEFEGDGDAVLDRQREAWVERIDIRELIPDPAMTRVNSLLDRGAVDRIADSLLRWKRGAEPGGELLGPRALLACTLTNLNGVPVDARGSGQEGALDDALQTTLYEDLRVFDLRLDDSGSEDGFQGRESWLVREDLGRPEVWAEIAGTCVAAGAFPVAFEPVALHRNRDEYGKIWPKQWEDIDSFAFTFSDGGMFNNEPLREVMNLIGWMDAEAGDFERVVVFIDPNLSGTTEDLSLDYYRELEVRDPDNTLWKLGRLFDGRDIEPRPYVDRMTALVAPLVGALKGQAAFKDWLAAEKVNNRLEWRGALRSAVIELLGILPDAAFDDGGEAAVFAEGVRESLEEVLEAKSGKSVRENPRLAVEREMERIEREETRTGREGKHLDALSEERREACALLFSLIDQVAGLRGRKQVRVVGIGPLDEEGRPLNLAGDFVANFGGFFKEEYRTYDFEVGRALAGRMLEGAGLLDEEARLEELPEKPDSDPTAASTPQAERLLERIKEVAGDFLDVRMDWPLKLDKLAIRLGKAKLGRMIAGALGEDEEPVFPYVVRLKITPAEPEHRFKLQGQDGGDSLDARWVERVLVVETLIFHAPGSGEVRGPHVKRVEVDEGDDDIYVLELVRDIRLQRDEHRQLALPNDGTIETLERMAYGKLFGEVDWKKVETEGEDEVLDEVEWEAKETLDGWRFG